MVDTGIPRVALRLGYVQRDVLDSLRDTRSATVLDLSEATGRGYGCVHSALTALLAGGLVRRWGRRSLGRDRGWAPWLWAITRAGRRELRIREAIGHVPGVPNSCHRDDGRLPIPWRAPDR